ncbi:hypothetical protein PIB30_033823 [Stylosanthes scabra]|uniref:Aminotransferase-like plant mobile domain-containing protein n=1 Tax=Stylosanthes scabra TaxID=79078 RepID=A0ABU6YB13_9FABA|nr:hypothetical protein [Stylosanthes scabra]
MLLLSTQLFGDKTAARVPLRWIPFMDQIDDIGQYSWGSATLAWLYRNICRASNRNVVYIAGPLQLLQSWIFWSFVFNFSVVVDESKKALVTLHTLYLTTSKCYECDRLSWGSAVLANLYQQMCRGTHWEAQNLGGCATLLLSWAYYRIDVCRPQGDYDELRFPLIERWMGYEVGMDSLGPRVRMWRMYLNGVDHAMVNWTPYADP